MAIKISKTKKRMKELFPNLNLSNAKLNAIVVKISKQIPEDADDDAIDSAITDLDDIVSFDKIVEESNKMSKLEKAAKSNKQKKGKKDDDEDDDPDDEAAAAAKAKAEAEKSGDDVPKWAQSLIKSNEDLSQELKNLKEGKIVDQKRSSARDLFEKSEVLKGLSQKRKDRLFKTIDIDDEDITVEQQIQELEEEEADFVQKTADDTDHAGPTPVATIDSKEPTKSELDAIVG